MSAPARSWRQAARQLTGNPHQGAGGRDQGHRAFEAQLAEAHLGQRFEFQHHKNGAMFRLRFPPSYRPRSTRCQTSTTTFLHTQAGNPRSAKALGNDFRGWCDKAKLPQRCTDSASAACVFRGRLQYPGAAIAQRSSHVEELQKYIDKADKRFAADRVAKEVIAHKAKQKPDAKSRPKCLTFSGWVSNRPQVVDLIGRW